MANTVYMIVPLIYCLISGYPRLSSRWFAGVTFGNCLYFQAVAIWLAYGLVSGYPRLSSRWFAGVTFENCLCFQVVAIWLACELVSGIDSVTIADMNPVTVSSIDSEVLLACVFDLPTPGLYSVDWSKGNGYHVITRNLNGRTVVGDLFIGRVHLVNHASLLLSAPRVNDTGLYTCSVLAPSDRHPADSKSVQLTVEDVPSGGSDDSDMSGAQVYLILGVSLFATTIVIVMVVVLWKKRMYIGMKLRKMMGYDVAELVDDHTVVKFIQP